MSFELRDYLRHILAETDYLLAQTAGLKRDEFVANETLRRAFVRSLEIVGEAAKKIFEEFRAQYPTVEWRAMSRMRDRLMHDYFGVDYELVWDVVPNRIPELRRQIASKRRTRIRIGPWRCTSIGATLSVIRSRSSAMSCAGYRGTSCGRLVSRPRTRSLSSC
jgi:uncharacterized protein with HEPN domain